MIASDVKVWIGIAGAFVGVGISAGTLHMRVASAEDDIAERIESVGELKSEITDLTLEQRLSYQELKRDTADLKGDTAEVQETIDEIQKLLQELLRRQLLSTD